MVDKIEIEMLKALCMYDLLTGSCNQLLVIVLLLEGIHKGMNMMKSGSLKEDALQEENEAQHSIFIRM